MKVLQLINSLDAGGAEKLLVQMIPLMQKAGVDVDLLLLKSGSHQFLELLEGTTDGKIIKAKSKGIYNPLHVFRLRRVFKNYDLVHVHLFPGLYWAALASALLKNSPKMVFTEHNTTNRRRNHWLLKHLDKMAYAGYHKLITISEDVDKNLKDHLHSFHVDRFTLIKNGVDLSIIQNAKPLDRSSLGLSDSELVILQVSSFTEQKDQACLIRAVKKLNHKAKLLLVGNGPKMDSCKRLVDELDLSGQVKFLGLRLDVPALLKTADIVVLSSNFEGLSLASIEGLASGVPFVASRAPGLTEVVQGAGVLFDAGNPDALADEIDKLVADKAYAQQVTQACLIRAKDYDIQKMKEQHLQLYHTLCPKKK